MAAKPTLSLNSEGADVTRLQRILGVRETGTFDQATEEALVRYQRAASLPATGVADAKTWTALQR